MVIAAFMRGIRVGFLQKSVSFPFHWSLKRTESFAGKKDRLDCLAAALLTLAGASHLSDAEGSSL